MDAIASYVLRWPQIGAGRQQVSCLAAVTRDARQATGRDCDSGNLIGRGSAGSWLGTIAYLVLLEQIGEAVYRPSGPNAQDGLPRALAHFATGLSDSEVGALAGLRNSLAHDYGLISQSGDALRRHMFQLGGDGPLVQSAASSWDRDWAADPSEYATRINVIKLSELAETVVDAVGGALWSRDLDTDLAGGRDELLARFHFVTTV